MINRVIAIPRQARKMLNVDRLIWDSGFLGLSVGRATLDGPGVSLAEVRGLLERESLDLLYVSCLAPLPTELDRFHIVDQVRYSGSVLPIQPTRFGQNDPRISEHPLDEADESLFQRTLEAGWSSRFQLDRNFSHGKFEQLYRIWINRSCLREIADKVFWILDGSDVSGFITAKVDGKVCRIGLIAVAANCQGQGLGKALMWSTAQFAQDRGCSTLEVVTQAVNHAAIRLYESFGLSRVETRHWYHFWRSELG
jgi:ribosomal protein S18 acetylase RimI-like enzyme